MNRDKKGHPLFIVSICGFTGKMEYSSTCQPLRMDTEPHDTILGEVIC